MGIDCRNNRTRHTGVDVGCRNNGARSTLWIMDVGLTVRNMAKILLDQHLCGNGP